MGDTSQPNERLVVDGEEFLWSDPDSGSTVSCRWTMWRSIGAAGSRRVCVVQPAHHSNGDLMAIAADVLFEVLLDPIRVETTRGVRATIDHWSVLAGDGNGLRQTVARALVGRIVDEAWQWAQENTLLTASPTETPDEPPSGDADDSDSGD